MPTALLRCSPSTSEQLRSVLPTVRQSLGVGGLLLFWSRFPKQVAELRVFWAWVLWAYVLDSRLMDPI